MALEREQGKRKLPPLERPRRRLFLFCWKRETGTLNLLFPLCNGMGHIWGFLLSYFLPSITLYWPASVEPEWPVKALTVYMVYSSVSVKMNRATVERDGEEWVPSALLSTVWVKLLFSTLFSLNIYIHLFKPDWKVSNKYAVCLTQLLKHRSCSNQWSKVLLYFSCLIHENDNVKWQVSTAVVFNINIKLVMPKLTLYQPQL